MLISIETYCTCDFSVGEGVWTPYIPPSLDLHRMFALTPEFYVNKDILVQLLSGNFACFLAVYGF